MITFISLAIVHKALKHLSHLNAISRMVTSLSKEMRVKIKWTPQIEQDISIQMFSALRATFAALDSGLSHDYTTPSDIHLILQRESTQTWQDTCLFLFSKEFSLSEVLVLGITIREVIIQELINAELYELNTFYVLTTLFDWINQQVVSQWEVQRNPRERVLSFGTIEIDKLRPIVESVRSPVDLHPVFQMIVERVRNSGIWPMCAIGMIDPEFKEIVVPAQAGFADSYPRDSKFPATGSATLETIRRNQPIAINDVAKNTEFPVLQEAARAAGYRSILLVPLVIEEIHAVVTFGSSEPHEFTQDEILLASAISQQVMIAIENARHYEREKQRVEELESLNNLIGEQNRLLQRVTETHTALTRLVLDDVGIEGILEAVRIIFGNPVAIEDDQFHLLAYSQDREHFDQHRLASIQAGGTTQEAFSNPEVAAIMNEMRKNRRSVLIPTLPAIGIEKRRIVAPIIAGGDILGYVWVMESLRPFDEQDSITAEQAALVLALEMVKQRAAYETELRLKADFIDDLFFRRSVRESELLQRASYLGYSFNHPAFLLLIECAGKVQRKEAVNRVVKERQVIDTTNQINRQLFQRVQQTANRYSRENIVVFQSRQIVVIAPVLKPHDDSFSRIYQLADDIRHELKQLDSEISVLIGASDISHNLAELRNAYEQARRVIEAARNIGRLDETFRLRDLGIYGILYQDDDKGRLKKFAKDSLQSLIEYDHQNGTELLRTIHSYLNHQGRLTETARHLYIHVNTLRLRIERIQELLGVEMDDPWTRLNLHLALQIYEVSNIHDRTG